MNLERLVDFLRNYRLRNERFDRIVGAVMSNRVGGKAVRETVIRVDALVQKLPRRRASAGDYDQVFFIAGEMRSGTSWLRRTVSAHPEIVCGHEGSFFGKGWSREEIPVYTGPVSSLTRALAVSDELAIWHGLPWNRWTDDAEEDYRNLARLSVDYFLAKEVARTGKRIVGDKSPQHTECLDEIYDIYPDAKIIHMVRDGRDVAVSAMNHWWRLAKDREDGVFELTPEELEIRDAYLEDREKFVAEGRSIFTEERLKQLARRWSYRVGKGRTDGRKLYRERYLEIRYEDLLDKPEEKLSLILQLLEARRGEPVVERCVRAGSFERLSQRSQGEEDASSFYRKGVAGDWKGVFTERDREIYESIAGEQLAAMGYET